MPFFLHRLIIYIALKHCQMSILPTPASQPVLLSYYYLITPRSTLSSPPIPQFQPL